MARRIPTPCTHVGPAGPCPELATEGGRCDDHPRKAWATTTKSRHERGYDARWVRLRNRYIRKHPVCEDPAGCDRPSEEVDHVIPLAHGGARLDVTNLQALCGDHHRQKTAREGR